jgi:hypothetical protein
MSFSSFFRGKTLWGAFFFFVAASVVAAGGKTESGSVETQAKPVVASTAWVAAIAEAAGAQNIRILAPVELRHPPEYELKPSDLEVASRAAVIVYGGWEMFAKKLAETAGGAGIQVVKVHTSNTPDNLKAEARKLAELFGTVDRFEEWSRNFDLLAEDLQEKIQAAYSNRRAVVHRAQIPFAQWAGLEIIGEYGPAEPSPAVIFQLVKTEPVLVIDNYHGPSGQPIAEAAGVPYAVLLNFPGKDGTKSMEDLFRYNADTLLKAAGR